MASGDLDGKRNAKESGGGGVCICIAGLFFCTTES